MFKHYFDFHHHRKTSGSGIYNLQPGEALPEGWFSAGIHPAGALSFHEKFNQLKNIVQHPNCMTIGECGLDGLVKIDEKLQETVFEAQIKLANDLRKPLIIHCVRRFQEIIRFRNLSEVPMIIHGFNKKMQLAEELLQHNFYLSFGTALLQNVSLQQTFKKIPADRFFLETDNSGSDIRLIYERAAEIRNCTPEEILQQVTANFQKITDGQTLARKN